MNKNMIEKRSWKEFQDAGMVWWINRIIHLMGWAIVLEFDEDGKYVSAYPVRCKFRGFAEESETKGFKKLTKFLSKNVSDLLKDCD